MSRVLPILFNTEMVRAILEGRKTVTRRLPSKRLEDKYLEYDEWAHMVAPSDVPCKILTEKEFYEQNTRYQVGDILYVRETWNHYNYDNLSTGEHREGYFYKASPELKSTLPGYVQLYWGEKWRPSIHMPKEAARIWLKVTDVRVERLQDITNEEAKKEGVICETDNSGKMHLVQFKILWDSTIRKSEHHVYGFDADPWVWVIEFERCEKPKEL